MHTRGTIGRCKNIYRKNGKVVQQWKGNIYPPAGGAAFRVDQADLTVEGKEEFLVAAMTTQSQGMGVQYWDVWAVSGTIVSNPVSVDDYGVMGFATRGKQENHCYLLATRWLWGWEPNRKNGLYLVGRWYYFSDGKLTPAFNRPMVYHRYLYSFERRRLKEISKGEPMPILWFTDKNTKLVIGPYPLNE